MRYRSLTIEEACDLMQLGVEVEFCIKHLKKPVFLKVPSAMFYPENLKAYDRLRPGTLFFRVGIE